MRYQVLRRSGSSLFPFSKDTQNPIASLISVPIQNNTNFKIGTANRTQDVPNVQPVICRLGTVRLNIQTMF